MAEVSFTVRAKDAAIAVLGRVTRHVRAFGKTVGNVSRNMMRFGRVAARAILALGAAAVTGATLAINAYRKQESAEISLANALRAHGEAVDKLMPKLKRVASAIQDQTGKGDEAVLSLMAQIKNLGITGDALEDATKGAMGLSKALGLNMTSAARYAALALQGEYTVLQRYIPALRAAKTEGEKAAIVNDMMAKGYQQLQADLGTTAGRWGELKGRIGDTLEKIGEAIIKGANLTGVMAGWSEAIKKFQNSEAFAAITAKLQGMVSDAVTLVEIISEGGKGRTEAISAVADVLKAAFFVGAEKVVLVLKKAAPLIGDLIGKAAYLAMNPIAAAAKSFAFRRTAVEQAAAEAKRDGKFESEAAFQARVKEIQTQLENPDEDTTGLTSAQIGLKKAMAVVRDIFDAVPEKPAAPESTSVLPPPGPSEADIAADAAAVAAAAAAAETAAAAEIQRQLDEAAKHARECNDALQDAADALNEAADNAEAAAARARGGPDQNAEHLAGKQDAKDKAFWAAAERAGGKRDEAMDKAQKEAARFGRDFNPEAWKKTWGTPNERNLADWRDAEGKLQDQRRMAREAQEAADAQAKLQRELERAAAIQKNQEGGGAAIAEAAAVAAESAATAAVESATAAVSRSITYGWRDGEKKILEDIRDNTNCLEDALTWK